MSWIRKLKELKRKQEAKDIEYIRNHPKRMKWGIAGVILLYLTISVLWIIYDAIPLAIIGIIFSIWIFKEVRDLYTKAFPKIDQAFTGLK